MTTPKLYRGPWPQNVSRLAKYGVRFQDLRWRVTVYYEVEDGIRYLAVEGNGDGLAEVVNTVKVAVRDQPGGAFYVNEYRHILVPVRGDSATGHNSHYYFAGRLEGDLIFEFEGQPLSTKPIDGEGRPLNSGDTWVGPRPGIPYVLAAGGADIYYETAALTASDPPSVRSNMTQKVQLSKVIKDRERVRRACAPLSRIKGHQGGRFYVNEHGAMFAPADRGDGDGLRYIYCGQIDRDAWFPEPEVG